MTLDELLALLAVEALDPDDLVERLPARHRVAVERLAQVHGSTRDALLAIVGRHVVAG